MDKNNGRNLTTAMLAFQAGVINRNQMLEAIRTWIKDKNLNLCDILVDQQAIDSDARDLLVAMVAKHQEMHADEPRRPLEIRSSIDSSLTKSLQELADPRTNWCHPSNAESFVRLAKTRSSGSREAGDRL